MFFIVFCIFALWLSYLVTRRPPRLLKQGKSVKRYHQTVGKRTYYIELVVFDDYHQALHAYFNIVPDIQSLDKLLDVKTDFMDWTNGIMRFKHFTLQLVREVNKIRLIKSDAPLSIEQFEADLSILVKSFR